MPQRYRYPPKLLRIFRLPATILVVVAMLLVSLTWARVILEGIAYVRGGVVPPFWQVPGETLPTLLAHHVALLMTLLVASVVGNALGDVTLSPEGFALHWWSTTKKLSWGAIHSFFATTMGDPARDLVFVRAKGLPFYTRLYGFAMGQGFVPGFVVTSDISNIEELAGALLEGAQTASGPEAAPFIEGATPTIVSMFGQPTQAMTSLSAPLTRFDQAPTEEDFPPFRSASTLMVVISLALPLAVAVAMLGSLRIPLISLVLFGLGLVEWLLASYNLVVLSDFFPGGALTFRQALTLYPYTQLPRWPIAALLAIFMLFGIPIWLLALVALGGIAWGCYQVALLTASIYRLPLQQGLIGSIVAGLFQALLYGLALWNLA